MSLYLPDTNAFITTDAALPTYLAVPATAAQKAANTGAVIGIWVRPPRDGLDGSGNRFAQTAPKNILTRGTGATGGNNGYLRFSSALATTLEAFISQGGSAILANTTVAAPGMLATTLVMLIINAANTHVVTCEVGGTPTVTTVATTTPYTTALTTNPLIGRIGPGSAAGGIYGSIEECFMLTGLFPETSGAPDTTLIANIANGTQSLDTLDALMTGSPTRKFRYRLRNRGDLADAWGVAADLTATNTDASTGRQLLSSGPLRPGPLRPTVVGHRMSQLTFSPTAPGVLASATTTINVEGGTYHGITPASIQARLLDEAGSEVRGWTTIDAAPSGGVFTGGSFAGVTGRAGWIEAEYRARDGGGAQIGDAVRSHGIKGTAILHNLQESQSQGIYYYDTASGGDGSPQNVPAGIRLLVTRQHDAVTREMFVARVSEAPSANELLRGITRGLRQAAIELNTLYPGVPIHFSTIGEPGKPLTDWISGGAHYGRWALIKARWGIHQPFIFEPMGHSANSGLGSIAAYLAAFETVINNCDTLIGVPERVVLVPTPRYSGQGTGSNFAQVEYARRAMRQWYEAHKSRAYWGGTWSVVLTDTEVGGSPHPSNNAAGQGRGGALIAWAEMCAINAVEDEILEIVGARRVGTTLRLKLGAT